MGDSLHVLLALSDHDDATDIETVLRARWPALTVHRVADPRDLRQALENDPLDLLVVGTDAPALAVEAIREAGWDRLLIAVSADRETRQAAELLQNGVRAVIHKAGINEIVPIVAREIGIQRDQHLRRQSDKALARSEARYRRLFEAAQDGILVLDAATGVVTEANPYLLRYLDCPAQTVIGKVATGDAVLAGVVGGADGLAGIVAAGACRHDNVALHTRSGRRVWADILATCHDIDGERVIQFNVSDVTARVLSEEGLSRANRALKTLSRANEALTHARSEAQLVDDACRIIVKVGGFRLAWVGYCDGAADNGMRVIAHHGHRDPSARLHAATWPVDAETLARAVTDGPQVVTVPAADGQSRCALVLPLRDKQGPPLGVVTIVADDRDSFDAGSRTVLDELSDDLAYGIRAQRDRTRYHATETALRDSESRFRTMAESASDALIVMDADGNVTFWNKAAEHIFGYTAAEAMGRNLHVLVATDQDLAAHRRAMTEFSRSGTGPAIGRRVDLTARRKDGSTFPVELTVSASQVNDRWQALGIVRDVSDRKLMEERLHQADKMDALGNMAGGIAHDLKNMLFPVLSLIGLTLKELPEGSRQRLRLEKVLQASQRARALVERIHAFSHREPLCPTEMEVAQAVAEAMGLIRPMLPATIEVRECWRFSPDSRVFIDLSQFDAVLMNFASNAADAMEDHPGIFTVAGGEVTLGAADTASIPVPAPGTYAWLSFTDTGTGMSEEVQHKIFDPWFSTKGKGKGTGLGLAMVKKIIVDHGGCVTVESAPAKGATFTIYLPLSSGGGSDAADASPTP